MCFNFLPIHDLSPLKAYAIYGMFPQPVSHVHTFFEKSGPFDARFFYPACQLRCVPCSIRRTACKRKAEQEMQAKWWRANVITALLGIHFCENIFSRRPRRISTGKGGFKNVFAHGNLSKFDKNSFIGMLFVLLYFFEIINEIECH